MHAVQIRRVLAHLDEPGLEVELTFRKVSDAVQNSTGNKKEPFVYGSLSGKSLACHRFPPRCRQPGKDGELQGRSADRRSNQGADRCAARGSGE